MSWFRSGWRTFQFTPLREGRRDCGKAGYVRWHFNSRPSARGDVCKSQRRERKSISIHAPPRGATFADSANAERLVISIHAPPRGATAGRQAGAYSPDYFNSRPSARGDAPPRALPPRPLPISIHAPPRGATRSSTFSTIRSPNFNSRPSARGDMMRHRLRLPPSYFNSRPSARGDGKRYAISANLLFNPYKSAWLNNSATQFVEIILVIFHRIIV